MNTLTEDDEIYVKNNLYFIVIYYLMSPKNEKWKDIAVENILTVSGSNMKNKSSRLNCQCNEERSFD